MKHRQPGPIRIQGLGARWSGSHRELLSAVVSTWALAWVRVGQGPWPLKILHFFAWNSWPPMGGMWSPRQEGRGALKSFLVNRGLRKRELSLLSSCPKLPEFRKEHTILVSAVFYFGSGRPKTTGRREIKVPIQSLPFPRIWAFFICLPVRQQLTVQSVCFSLISHIHCFPNCGTCFGLFLYFLFCCISNLFHSSVTTVLF